MIKYLNFHENNAFSSMIEREHSDRINLFHANAVKLNTLRPRENERHFADDILKCTFMNENVWISIKISLKFVPKGPINNIPALVWIMAWRCPGDKPLSELMMVGLPTDSFHPVMCLTMADMDYKYSPDIR